MTICFSNSSIAKCLVHILLVESTDFKKEVFSTSIIIILWYYIDSFDRLGDPESNGEKYFCLVYTEPQNTFIIIMSVLIYLFIYLCMSMSTNANVSVFDRSEEKT